MPESDVWSLLGNDATDGDENEEDSTGEEEKPVHVLLLLELGPLHLQAEAGALGVAELLFDSPSLIPL
jgi:hypothetical protein